MGLREKVALALLAVIILQITCTLCMPPSIKKNAIKDLISNSKNKHASPPQPIQIIKSTQTDKSVTPEIDTPKDRSSYKVIHFPEVEYPSFNFAEGQTSWRYNDCTEPIFPFEIPDVKITDPDDSKFLNNLRKEAKKKRKQNAMKNKEKETSNQNPADILSLTMLSPQLFTNINAFPEVEYPLSASETWKPNYWIHYTYPLTEEPIKILEHSLPNVVKQNEITFYKPLNKTIVSKPQQKELIKSARILSSLDNINKLNTASDFTPQTKTKKLRSKKRNSKVTTSRSNKSRSPKINLNNSKNISNSLNSEINETNNTRHIFSLVDDNICLVDNKTEFDDKDIILDPLYSNLYPPLLYQNISDTAQYPEAGYYDIVSLDDDAQKKSHMFNVDIEKKGNNSSAPITIVVIPSANAPINIDYLIRGIFGNSVSVSQSNNKSVPVNEKANDTESTKDLLNKEMPVPFNPILNWPTEELVNEIIRVPDETILSDFVSGGLPIKTMPVAIEQILHSPSEGLQSKVLTMMIDPTSSLSDEVLPTEELPAAISPVSSLPNEEPILEVLSATIDPILSLPNKGIPTDAVPIVIDSRSSPLTNAKIVAINLTSIQPTEELLVETILDHAIDQTISLSAKELPTEGISEVIGPIPSLAIDGLSAGSIKVPVDSIQNWPIGDLTTANNPTTILSSGLLSTSTIEAPIDTASNVSDKRLQIDDMPLENRTISRIPIAGLPSKVTLAEINPLSNIPSGELVTERISNTKDPKSGVPIEEPLTKELSLNFPNGRLTNGTIPIPNNITINQSSEGLLTPGLSGAIDPKSTVLTDTLSTGAMEVRNNLTSILPASEPSSEIMPAANNATSSLPIEEFMNKATPVATYITSSQISNGFLTPVMTGVSDPKSSLATDRLSPGEDPNNLIRILPVREPSPKIIPAKTSPTSNLPTNGLTTTVIPVSNNHTLNQTPERNKPIPTLTTGKLPAEIMKISIDPTTNFLATELPTAEIPASIDPTLNLPTGGLPASAMQVPIKSTLKLPNKGVTTNDILLSKESILTTQTRGQQSVISITNAPISSLLTDGSPAGITKVPTNSILSLQAEELTTDITDKTENMPIGVLPAKLLPFTLYPTLSLPTQELLIDTTPGVIDSTSNTLSERLLTIPMTAAITSKPNLPLGGLPGGDMPVSIDLISSQLAEGLLPWPTLATTDPISSFSTSGAPVDTINVSIDPTLILSTEVMPMDRPSSVLTCERPTELIAIPINSEQILPAPIEPVPTIELSANVTLVPIDLTSNLGPTSNLNPTSTQIIGLPTGEISIPIVPISNMPMEAMLIPTDTSTLPSEELLIDTTAAKLDSLSGLLIAKIKSMPAESPLYEIMPGAIQQTLNFPTEGLPPEIMLVPINPLLSCLSEGQQLQAMVDFHNHESTFPNNGVTEIIPVLIDPKVMLPSWSKAIDVIPVLINSSSGLPTGVLLTDVFSLPNKFTFSLSVDSSLSSAETSLPVNQISNLCPAESPSGVHLIPKYLTSGSPTELPIEVVPISNDFHLLNDGHLADLMLIPIKPSSNMPKEALLFNSVSAPMDPTTITPTRALPSDIIPGLLDKKSSLPSDEIQVIKNSKPGPITELRTNSLLLPNFPTLSFLTERYPTEEMTDLAHPTSNSLDEELPPKLMTILIDPVTDLYNEGFLSDGILAPMYRTFYSQGEGQLNDIMLDVGLCSNNSTSPTSNEMPRTELSLLLIDSTSNLPIRPIRNKTIPLSMNLTSELPFGGQSTQAIPVLNNFKGSSISNALPIEVVPVLSHLTSSLPTGRTLTEISPNLLTEELSTKAISATSDSTANLPISGIRTEIVPAQIESTDNMLNKNLSGKIKPVGFDPGSSLSKERELIKTLQVPNNTTSNLSIGGLQAGVKPESSNSIPRLSEKGMSTETLPIPNNTIPSFSRELPVRAMPVPANSIARFTEGGSPAEIFQVSNDTTPNLPAGEMPVSSNSIPSLTEGGMPTGTWPVANNTTPSLPPGRLLAEVMPYPIDLKPSTLTHRKSTELLSNSTVALSFGSLPAEGKQPVRKNLTSNPRTKDLQGKSTLNKQLASFNKELADIPIEEELLPVHPTDKGYADLIEQKHLQPVKSTAMNTLANTKTSINNTVKNDQYILFLGKKTTLDDTTITSVALNNNTNKQSSDEASIDNVSSILSNETDKLSLPVNKQSSRQELPLNTNNTSACKDLPSSEELLPADMPSDISDYTAMPFETTDIWTASADSDSMQLYTIADISPHKEIHPEESSSGLLGITDLSDYTAMPFGT